MLVVAINAGGGVVVVAVDAGGGYQSENSVIGAG